MKIKFTSIFDDIPQEFYPKPASYYLPNWYKETNSYFENKLNTHTNIPQKTIKKCIPIYDSITSGYIIVSAIDINVVASDQGFSYFEWPNKFNYINNKRESDPIQFHDFDQVKNYPNLSKEERVAKFINPWGIQTPKGYSVFITNPVHRELPFEIFPAIVDTDTNHAPIHFPFLLKEKRWSGVIPSGTPIAQVIPFKRDSWEYSIGKDEDQKRSLQQVFYFMSSYKNAYKKGLWSKKEFK